MRESPSWSTKVTHFTQSYKISLKLLGLFFVAAILALPGCKKPDPTSGIDLLPEEDLLNANRTDTLTLLVQSEREDSLRTDELSVSLVGSYVDPKFGMVRASAVSQLKLSTTSALFPIAYEVDSIVLYLEYDGYLYGRIGSPYFLVNEIEESLVLDSNYYSNKQLAVKPDNLMKDGEERQAIKPFAVLQGTTTIPPLRLPLDESLAAQLMSPTDPSVLTSDDNFRAYFKGIQISTLAEANGGVFNVDLVDPGSRMTIYYRNQDGMLEDTTSYTYTITTDCARFTRFEHEYGGSLLQGIEAAPLAGEISCFIHAASGSKVKIEIPHLEEFNALDRRTVNGADLIIPFDNDPRFAAQEQLVLLYKNSSGELRVLPDQTSQTIGGLADFVANVYRFRIPRYIQGVLDGEISSQGLYLLSTRAGVSVNRVVCHGPAYSPDVPSQNMRLILTLSSD